jgi:hypothetical protein
MTSADLENLSIRFDPELDLETVADLPGKDIMQDLMRKFDDGANRSRLIQDSHGWCFHVRGEDGRKYLVELSYVATKDRASNWVLSCSRCTGFRFWEWFTSPRSGIGEEPGLLAKRVEFLVSNHGFREVAH